MNKEKLRKLMLKKRSELTKSVKDTYDAYIYKEVIKYIKRYNSIGIFVSFNSEINTRNIIQYCFDHEIKVSVPKITSNKMIFVTINSWSDLKPGIWGILEPYSDKECLDIDLCITPLLAFNSKLNRLGYGGGYYDNYFSSNNVFKLGIAYGFQYQDFDIFEKFDIKLDEIIKAI